MVFSLLVAFAGINLLTAQDVGRFVHTIQSSGCRMIYDVSEYKSVAFTFNCPGGTFRDTHRPLVEVANHVYRVDFAGSIEGIRYWYRGMKALMPELNLRTGDLEFIYYLSGDSLATNVDHRRVDALRVGYDPVPGLFAYRKEDGSSFVDVKYTVSANRKFVHLKVECERGATAHVPFRLVLSDVMPYKTFNVETAGYGTVEALLRQVRQVCPTQALSPGDLGNVVFASASTMFSSLGRARILLSKSRV